ncbi:MAG: DUF3034 family protein [Rhodanobacteraceae bacterium]
MRSKHKWGRAAMLGGLILIGGLVSTQALAQDTPQQPLTGGKLLLTGGVSEIGGAAGGGLTPWAVIGGYDSSGQVGASAFYTRVDVQDYHLDDYGVAVGVFNRVELSVAQQKFNTENVGAALGLGRGFTFQQDIIGVKVRLFGDLVLDQDSWLPQVAVGAQYKKNNQGAVVQFVGAKRASGVDYYVSATKLFLAQSLLVNATVRFTEANQIGILGFGGDKHNGYQAEFEGSVAYLLNRHLAIGAEYRQKPNNLSIAQEDDWYDAFVAWAPNQHVSLTLAYADLGNIVIEKHQHGLYASVQVGF